MAHLKVVRQIPARRTKVFDFLVNPKNLPWLLESHIEVELDNVSAQLAKDSTFSFLMTRFGFSQPVKITIKELHRDSLLTYRQSQGLFESWVHSTKFEDAAEGETLVTDIVEYHLPFGLLGHLFDDLWLRRDMEKILGDRLERAVEYFDESHGELNGDSQV